MRLLKEGTRLKVLTEARGTDVQMGWTHFYWQSEAAVVLQADEGQTVFTASSCEDPSAELAESSSLCGVTHNSSRSPPERVHRKRQWRRPSDSF